MDTPAESRYAARWTSEGTSGETTVTEAEWLACTEPNKMFIFLQSKGATYRKLRLYRYGCLRRMWDRLDYVQRLEVEDGERRAERVGRAAYETEFGEAWLILRDAPDSLFGSIHAQGQEQVQAAILRDLFGNPFRPITFDPALLTWHGGLLVSMAQRMYDSRDFSDMPVLADALEEAGCQDQDILGHCRQQGGVHARGCWVVDSLLGKQ
jgi:hypothetical protein